MSTSPYRKVLLALAAICLPAFAGTDTLGDGMRKCTRESDTARRLACFDTLASALPKIQADLFGITAQIKENRDPAAPERARNETLTGKIASLRQASRGELIFTLDNGQVWVQVEPSSKISFKTGEDVRIEHGAMSSLWLAADHGRKTKVKRIS